MPDDREMQNGVFNVRTELDGDRRLLIFEGELDLAYVGMAEKALLEALGDSRPVVFDLRRLEFIDSTGLALIARTLGGPDAERVSFLHSEALAVRRVLEVTGLDVEMTEEAPMERLGD